MTSFEAITTDIFDRSGERRFASVEDERQAIAKAKTGDSDATVDVLYAYAAVLRNSVRALPADVRDAALEDIRQEAILGLLEAVRAWDGDRHLRLAAIASQYVADAVSKAASAATGFTVPERTLKRFFGILRKADGNIYDAARLAPSYEMTTETFLAVLSSVRNVESYSASETSSGDEDGSDLLSRWDSAESIVGKVRTGEEIVEDELLVEVAFGAVDDLEEDVVRLAYGFADYNTLADIEVGERLGLSRPKVQRVRSGALGKMRLALGVA